MEIPVRASISPGKAAIHQEVVRKDFPSEIIAPHSGVGVGTPRPRKLKEAPIDVAFIGIGENGHVAFNDPPADFTTDEAYIIVDLDEKCK